MSIDYEISESAWDNPVQHRKYWNEVIMAGYNLGICNDDTGEVLYVVQGRR